jgi:hypothetical protein
MEFGAREARLSGVERASPARVQCGHGRAFGLGRRRSGRFTCSLICDFVRPPLFFSPVSRRAYANPIADLFNRNATPQQATAPTSPEETCLPRPGQSTRAGLRWVYRVNGKRKCWFQTEGFATKDHGRYRPAKPSGGASAENESTQKRKTIGDARAELLRAALPETPLPMRPAPELKVADAAPMPSTEAEVSLRTEIGTDRLTSDYRTERQLGVEALGPTNGNAAAASAPKAPPVMLLISEASDDWPG